MKISFVIIAALCALLLPAFAAAQVRVSDDGRHLVDEEGRPFLWLGDTAWELFHRLDREEARFYLDRRAAQGFSVIQAVVLAENNGLRTPNAYGELPLHDLDPAQPNERYFEHVDFIVTEARRRGLLIALLPTWGDKVPSANPGTGPVVFTPENARSFGRFIGGRYRNASIVWMLGGDRGIDSPEALAIWREMAQGLRAGDGGAHLITFHPRGNMSSATWLHNEPWLDFNVYQSGHASRYQPVHRFAADLALLHPFLDAEPPYEDIPIRFWQHIDWTGPERVPAGVLDERGLIVDRSHFRDGFFTDHDVRVHAYWNLLSGACGHTYGHNAVWQMHQIGRPAAIPCLQDWRAALDQPGAQQIRHVRALFTLKAFERLVPDQSIVYGPNPDGRDHVRAAGSTDRSFALVYVTLGQPVDVVMGKVGGATVNAWWFNPRTGGAIPEGAIPNERIHHFVPPTNGPGQDWMLVLERQ